MTTEYKKASRGLIRRSIRRILAASIYISLFMILTYAMTGYGFYKGGAEFTIGAQIGCILLGLIVSTFSYLMWGLIVGGYDVLMKAVNIAERVIERKRAKEANTDSDEVMVVVSDEETTVL